MISPAASTLVAIDRALARAPFRFSNEIGLQDAVEGLLRAAGLTLEREVVLGESVEDRVDFLVEPGVALEVKIEGRVTEIVRQLQRYAAYDRVSMVVLATTRLSHREMPAELRGKPVRVLYLMGATFG